MLTRSRRDDLHSKATSADLGPGSYDAKVADFKPKSGMAPFSSTTERVTGLATSFKTPGPGSYNTSIPGKASFGQGSPQFLSQSQRGVGLFSANDVPGPGAYSGELVVDHKNRQPVKPKKPNDITWVKVATAPSIPASGQSYGYEEGQAGELVQTCAPYVGHTGQGGDQPGPGEYDPSVNAIKKSSMKTKFSASGKRSEVVPRELRDHPGPGAYDPQNCGTGDAFKGGVAARKPQSSFASSTSRNFISASARDGPGPGSYKPPSSFVSLREHLAAQPESFHAFGSSGKQPHNPGREEIPGPGAYSPPVTFTAGHPTSGVGSSFASKTTRFIQGPREFTPGPGGYEAVAGTLEEKLSKKVHGRYGVFGSTSQRFKEIPPVSNASPATYNAPSLDFNPAELRRKDKRSSVFRSGTKREAPFAKPPKETEGAGTQYYNVKLDWPKPSHGAMPKAPRFSPTTVDVDAPGPGDYAARSAFDLAKTVPSKSSLPKASRFPHEKVADGPGPGAYNAPSSLIRKTFNITIGDSWE